MGAGVGHSRLRHDADANKCGFLAAVPSPTLIGAPCQYGQALGDGRLY